MRHRRILDVANENPEATMAEIASEVPSATTELVEHVLEEYGDPGVESDESGAEQAEQGATTTDGGAPDDQEGAPAGSGDVESGDGGGSDSTTDTADSDETLDRKSVEPESTAEYPVPDDLTDAQRETLRAIAASPEATQRELAASLDVTAATVSKRVNDLDGFDWDDRQTFAERVLDDADSETTMPESDIDQPSIDELTDQIERLQDRIDELAEPPEARGDSAFDDPDLVHKLVRASVESDDITEDEERRIVAELMG